jgi:hypothetical protein
MTLPAAILRLLSLSLTDVESVAIVSREVLPAIRAGIIALEPSSSRPLAKELKFGAFFRCIASYAKSAEAVRPTGIETIRIDGQNPARQFSQSPREVANVPKPPLGVP